MTSGVVGLAVLWTPPIQIGHIFTMVFIEMFSTLVMEVIRSFIRDGPRTTLPDGESLFQDAGLRVSGDLSRWQHLAFISGANGTRRIWIRPLNSPAARSLAGTEERHISHSCPFRKFAAMATSLENKSGDHPYSAQFQGSNLTEARNAKAGSVIARDVTASAGPKRNRHVALRPSVLIERLHMRRRSSASPAIRKSSSLPRLQVTLLGVRTGGAGHQVAVLRSRAPIQAAAPVG